MEVKSNKSQQYETNKSFLTSPVSLIHTEDVKILKKDSQK